VYGMNAMRSSQTPTYVQWYVRISKSGTGYSVRTTRMLQDAAAAAVAVLYTERVCVLRISIVHAATTDGVSADFSCDTHTADPSSRNDFNDGFSTRRFF